MGVISALMLIEANNVEQHEKKRCKYCNGKGVCQFVPSMKFQLITDYLLNMKSFYITFRLQCIEIQVH